MAIFQYPHTDFHELNLDWVIQQVKLMMEAWASTKAEWDDTKEEFEELKAWIASYFDNLNVQTEINNKLDAMYADGSLSSLIAPYVASGLPAVVANQIGAVVATQIGAVVAAQIGDVVAAQIGTPAAAAAAEWLSAHVDPSTGYVVDNSLTVIGAAADAKQVGDAIRATVNNVGAWTGGSYVTPSGTGSSAAFSYSDYIEVSPLSVIDIHTYIYAYASIVFYDASKERVDYYQNGTGTIDNASYDLTYTVPPNVKYMRISCLTASLSDFHYEMKTARSIEYANRSLHCIINSANGCILDVPSAPYDDMNTLPVNTILTYDSLDVVPSHTPLSNTRPFNVLTVSSYYSTTIKTAITQLFSYYNGQSFIRSAWGWDSGTQTPTWSDWKEITYTPDAIPLQRRSYDQSDYYFTDILKGLRISDATTLVVVGDSIANGVTSDSEGHTSHTTGFVGDIATLTGCTVKNYAVASSSFASSDNVGYDTQIIDQFTGHDISGDVLLVAGGTNDFGFGNSESDFETALTSFFDYVDLNFTGDVCVLLPINRTYPGEYSVLPLNYYRETLYRYAIERGYSVIDGSSFGFPDQNDDLKAVLIGDGLHPTVAGHALIASQIVDRTM